MIKIELNGMVYEFKNDYAVIVWLDENANRVYEKKENEN